MDINARKLAETADPDLSIQYIDISSVNSRGEVGTVDTMRFEVSPSRARRLPRRGDTIVSTVRTYLRAIAHIADVPEDATLVCSTGFAVLSARPAMHPKFLFYWMRSNPVVDEICARSVGVSYPAINPSDFSGLPICVPPPEAQRAIADFLDRKTAAIDALVAQKERLIALLQEKRQALITQAVTKGLDPNVPMKDSGIEWLGEIPAHWDVVKVKHLTEIRRGRFSHRPRNEPRFYDGRHPFIQTGDVSQADKYVTEHTQTLNELGLAISRKFPAGTLAMTITGAKTGSVAILQFDACFPDSVVGFIPRRTNSDFLYYLFHALKPQLDATATVSTQENLNVERIGNQPCACPPQADQHSIVQQLQSQLSTQFSTIRRLRRSISLLREYRQAVITGAVTGKLDVTSEAA
ncbi:MAG: restriction endonuclease subunit S [Sandaracinaceae bacterium]